MPKLSFDQWKQQIDNRLMHILGQSSEDLPDIDYLGCWEDNATPSEMVDLLLKKNGWGLL